jgi:hypothetical protein
MTRYAAPGTDGSVVSFESRNIIQKSVQNE